MTQQDDTQLFHEAQFFLNHVVQQETVYDQHVPTVVKRQHCKAQHTQLLEEKYPALLYHANDAQLQQVKGLEDLRSFSLVIKRNSPCATIGQQGT